MRTLDPADLKASLNKGETMRVSGKMAILEAEFVSHSISIVGIQETRIQENSDNDGYHYGMISSSANEHGTQGIQIWILVSLKPKILVSYLFHRAY